MGMSATCPGCGRRVSVAASQMGQTVACPGCGQQMRLAGAATARPTAAPTSGASVWVILLICGAAAFGLFIVVGILAALLLPAIGQAREAARRTQSRNNMHQLGLALHNYHDTHGTFPPGYVQGKGAKPMTGFLTMALPFVDETAVYNAYNFEWPWDEPANQTAGGQVLSMYLCPNVADRPTVDGYGTTHYLGVCVGDPAAPRGGVFGRDSNVRIRNIRDGTSQTLLMGEACTRVPAWASTDVLRDTSAGINTPNGFGNAWRGGTFFLFADGAVRFISENVDATLMRALTTRDGNEIVDDEDF